VDHPSGATVQLADGRWRHVLAYRLLHSPMIRSCGTYPAPQVGCYVEEVVSDGPVLPAWTFAGNRETPAHGKLVKGDV
jgi:hypothetical protein